MAAQETPALSVILATPYSYNTIRETIGYLRKQTARRRMELVIVAPSAKDLDLNAEELADFLCYRVVDIGKVRSIGCANASGVRGASAPIIALAEDHAFPAPEWAETLIRAHHQDWAAVGAVIGNANPETIVSWADFLMGYSQWLAPALAGVRDLLPSHNGSYKREVLLSYGSQLDAMMDSESVLHYDLRKKGYRLFLDPSAQVFHMNFGTLASILPSQFLSGQVFASSRASAWSPFRRLGYILGAPLIPLVRLRRIVDQTRRSKHWDVLPAGTIPMLFVALIASALGELKGYAVGAGEEAKRRLAMFEFHRVRYQPNWRPSPAFRESTGML
jgi:GT2 family glycosyltransferase